MADLIQGKGSFVLRGIIAGKDEPKKGNGLNEGKISSGKNAGKPWKSIRFLVKTSPTNVISVELFGQEKEVAYLYNKEKKQSAKVEWAKRNTKPKEGWNLIVPEIDLIDTINNDFKDGDSVTIVGENQFSTYTDEKAGTTKLQVKHIIKKIYRSQNEVDFNSDKFVEKNEFEQDIVIDQVIEDDKTNKLLVHANIIGYKGSFYPAMFEINTTTADPDFVKNFKTMKYGDSLKVFGKIYNSAVITETTGEWGKQPVKSFKKCMEIEGADGTTYQKKLYKETDFAKTSVVDVKKIDDVLTSLEKDQSDDLPFTLDDDDLPF